MATPHNIQTKQDIVKPLQYFAEGDTVVTPADYAGDNTVSPTYIVPGHVTDINLQPDIQHLDTDVLGNEDLIDAIKTGEMFAFQITFEMIDTLLIDFAFSASGGAVGSIDESLEFMFSELLDGTENYTFMKGSRPVSCTCTLEGGVWIANMTFICKEITLPVAVDPNTTPTYATEPAVSSITHTGAGPDPFEYNAIKYPESRFSTTVTRGMAVQKINGSLTIDYCKASTRAIDFSVDIFIKDKVLETEFKDKTKRVATYSISTSPNLSFNYTDCVLTSHSRQKTATNADAFKESITARAETVAIAA